ncbi:SMP-30/Gluconolaconase/LRE-like region [seawater metagenome]|uniref:SMP-30/Gluconolaconase/LRE-like region n=1 Tax=seawater metagenome TaxID=1561972 RepID=A0A5E8CLR8_9ZZZZ
MNNHINNVLIILASNKEKKNVIESLKRENVHLHFFDNSDFIITPPVWNPNINLALITKQCITFAKKNKCNSVMYFFDIANLIASIVCQELNIPGPSFQSVITCYFKPYLRSKCKNSIINGTVIKLTSENLNSIELTFPIYAKPPCLSYGLLSKKILNKKELDNFLPEYFNSYSKWWKLFKDFFKNFCNYNNHDLIEESIPLYLESLIDEKETKSVTCDGFIYNNDITIIGFVDTNLCKKGVDSYSFPSKHSNYIKEKVKKELSIILNKIDLSNTLFSAEFWIFKSGEIDIMEINARMSSTFRNLYLNALEIDIFKIAYQISTNQCPILKNNLFCQKYCHRSYIISNEDGIASNIIDYNMVKTYSKFGIFNLNINYPENSLVKSIGQNGVPILEIDIYGKTEQVCQEWNIFFKKLFSKKNYLHNRTYNFENILASEGIININENQLMWMEYEFRKLVFLNLEDNKLKRFNLPKSLADDTCYSVCLNYDEKYFIGGTGGLHLWDLKTNNTKILIHEPINDICVDNYGRIYAGSIPSNKNGKLFLINKNGEITVEDQNIQYSNGLTINKDGSILYFIDSFKLCIYQYDIEINSGKLYNKTVLISFSKNYGIPDGLAIDKNNNIWVTFWFGSLILCINTILKSIEEEILLPVQNITSCCFGGPKYNQLFVTTSNSLIGCDEYMLKFAPNRYIQLDSKINNSFTSPIFSFTFPNVFGLKNNVANITFSTLF